MYVYLIILMFEETLMHKNRKPFIVTQMFTEKSEKVIIAGTE